MMKPTHYSACYGIIKNDSGEVLFQKRKNTSFRNGCFQIPAGHIEGEETIKECLIREMKEELGIDIIEVNIDIAHICHRITPGEKVYFDIYLNVKRYSGTLQNAEPEKCEELKFIDINSISDKKLFGYDVEIIKMIQDGIKFSEIKG